MVLPGSHLERTDKAARTHLGTANLPYAIYQTFYFANEYGLASAASYVLFLAIALLALVQFRVLRSKD